MDKRSQYHYEPQFQPLTKTYKNLLHPVDWSALHLGVNIPVTLQSVFYQNMKLRLKRGDTKKIKLLLQGEKFEVKFTNISFDERKYPNHKDLLQIRYTPNSDIAKKLRETFYCSYNYLQREKELLENKRKQLSVPHGQREYIAIYSTQIEDTFIFDAITINDVLQLKQDVEKLSETELELLLNTADDPKIIKKVGFTKIRKLDKSIGEMLKIVYNFKCQICGVYVGKQYDAKVIHTHHIEYFSISLNNNPSNIMVLCPNHHGIIHATNPIFNQKEKTFCYPNGYVEGLMLNEHL